MQLQSKAMLLFATLLASCEGGSKIGPGAESNGVPSTQKLPVQSEALQCRIEQDVPFTAGREVVRLARGGDLPADSNFAMFVAPLAVNTDGAPTSYHPRDFFGASLAINRIDNGIAIRKAGGVTVSDKKLAFEQWRDSGWSHMPAGFSINWRNVIAADDDGKPCVFKSPPDAGYFGSLTALKNGLSGIAAGECGRANQLDQRYIPAIVLRGNANPLKSFGAKTGDLVIAINPANGNTVPAVIGDTGDGDRIGEGLVALNMALLGKTQQPQTYGDALKLDTGKRDMIVAVLPKTITYRRERPYSAVNIAARVDAWAKEQGYGSTAGLAQTVSGCAPGL